MSSLQVDPRILPWSKRGSYMCIATRAGKNGELTPAKDVYLVHHINGSGLPLFALRPVVDQQLSAPSGFHQTPSPVDFNASPSVLRWFLDEETICEATFHDARTIRLRGRKPLSFDTEGFLRVDHWRCWLFHVPPAAADSVPTVEFTCTPNVALRFIAIKGELEVTNGAPFDPMFKNNNRRLTVSANQDGWELLVVERETGSTDLVASVPLDEFDSAAKRMKQEFDHYVSELCPWEKVTKSDRLACYVMWTSTVRPAGFLTSEAVLMSKLWMNKVCPFRFSLEWMG